jgi:hypothetical protein
MKAMLWYYELDERLGKMPFRERINAFDGFLPWIKESRHFGQVARAIKKMLSAVNHILPEKGSMHRK